MEITSADHAAGFDAARLNLRLAGELGRGDFPTSRAYWMIGAYHLAEGDYKKALTAFEQGSSFAKKADALGDEMLNQGYQLLSKMLISPSDSSLRKDYEQLKENFLSIDHGEDFIQQLETAFKVFTNQSEP